MGAIQFHNHRETLMQTAATERTYDKLQVRIFADQAALAAHAAQDAAALLGKTIAERGEANMMVATGNAALQFMAALRQEKSIEWSKVTLFHMDEYVGISDKHPASFPLFVRVNLVDWVKPKAAHYIHGDTGAAQAECQRYSELLRTHPIDLCHCGVGENGHLAFNDPSVADFNDPYLVKVVELDATCRRQQVGEGHFKTMADVPTHALSVTIPGLLAAKHIICVVPETRKAQAIRDALLGPIATSCPASILRQQSHAVLYLDKESSSLL
jgi:glucosamine-6-phosphate deaminase